MKTDNDMLINRRWMWQLEVLQGRRKNTPELRNHKLPLLDITRSVFEVFPFALMGWV